MAAFYDYFNEQKYADAVKNVSIDLSVCKRNVKDSICPLNLILKKVCR